MKCRASLSTFAPRRPMLKNTTLPYLYTTAPRHLHRPCTAAAGTPRRRAVDRSSGDAPPMESPVSSLAAARSPRARGLEGDATTTCSLKTLLVARGASLGRGSRWGADVVRAHGDHELARARRLRGGGGPKPRRRSPRRRTSTVEESSPMGSPSAVSSPSFIKLANGASSGTPAAFVLAALAEKARMPRVWRTRERESASIHRPRPSAHGVDVAAESARRADIIVASSARIPTRAVAVATRGGATPRATRRATAADVRANIASGRIATDPRALGVKRPRRRKSGRRAR